MPRRKNAATLAVRLKSAATKKTQISCSTEVGPAEPPSVELSETVKASRSKENEGVPCVSPVANGMNGPQTDPIGVPSYR